MSEVQYVANENHPDEYLNLLKKDLKKNIKNPNGGEHRKWLKTELAWLLGYKDGKKVVEGNKSIYFKTWMKEFRDNENKLVILLEEYPEFQTIVDKETDGNTSEILKLIEIQLEINSLLEKHPKFQLIIDDNLHVDSNIVLELMNNRVKILELQKEYPELINIIIT